MIEMRWVGASAVLGGLLWGAKSIAILITGSQPDYLFEIAPAAIGVAALGLAVVWRRERGGGGAMVGLGAVAAGDREHGGGRACGWGSGGRVLINGSGSQLGMAGNSDRVELGRLTSRCTIQWISYAIKS